MRIALADEMNHLTGRDRRRPHNRIGTGWDIEHGPSISFGQLPIGLFQGLGIDAQGRLGSLDGSRNDAWQQAQAGCQRRHD